MAQLVFCKGMSTPLKWSTLSFRLMTHQCFSKKSIYFDFAPRGEVQLCASFSHPRTFSLQPSSSFSSLDTMDYSSGTTPCWEQIIHRSCSVSTFSSTNETFDSAALSCCGAAYDSISRVYATASSTVASLCCHIAKAILGSYITKVPVKSQQLLGLFHEQCKHHVCQAV